ncbi:MAG: glycosyltransferase family 2 protein [bacterium]
MLSKISIVIPVYNGEKTIGRCLDSIFSSNIKVPFEVIIVDDGSTDNTAGVVQEFACRYLRIEKSGVAAARNFGIKEAKGDIIFFFDADVILKKDTLEKFLRHFEEDTDAYIIQGRWDRKSPISTFSSEFFLLKYTYNFAGLFKDKRRIEAANLETGCLGIRKEVFNYFKGFNEGYKFSGGEEHELGIRLLARYKIFYYPDIFVEHGFGNILPALKKIYRRTINFSILSFQAKNKDFMKLHSNSVPLQDKLSIIIISLMGINFFLLFFKARLALILFIILLLIYIINIYKFLFFLLKEKGIFFAMKRAVADFTIMLPRLLGILKAIYIYFVLRQKDYRV